MSTFLYSCLIAIVILYVFAFFFSFLLPYSNIILSIYLLLILADIIILFSNKKGISAKRETLDRLSNSDENPVEIFIENFYLFNITAEIIDELPFQFQIRDSRFKLKIKPGNHKIIQYFVRPVKRGEYHFGAVNVFVKSPLGLIVKRYKFSENKMVPVYPSFMQMRKYELFAISNRLNELGIKKIRKIGNNNEFDKIKDYVSGDDYRTINWKATARKSKLMVNQYQDERAQQVYSIIDMGRLMKMPFNGLSLLDYSINSSLVISNIAMLKHDKAGIITFSDRVQSILPAERKSGQLNKILHLLYNQRTNYLESDYEHLYIQLKKKLNQRSLILLFSNFETLSGLKRQIKYLQQIAKNHLLVTIFFENIELKSYIQKPVTNTIEIYNKAIAEKFIFEKKLIIKELSKYGIQCIYTAPENLSVNTINKYLELKSRGLI